MKKLVCTTLAACIFTTIGVPAFALGVDALPNLPTDVENLNVSKNGANMNITVGGGQAGAVDTIIWKDYNIGKDATVNYEFTNHNQTSINKVDVGGGLSEIYGKITNSSSCVDGAACGYETTSKVFLLNPNGVLFGNTANVNLNSFTVSTFDITQDPNDPTKFTFIKTNASTSDHDFVTIDVSGWTEEQIKDELGDAPNKVLKGKTIYVYPNIKPIAVKEGATINGEKGVNFVADTIFTYKGSLISTYLQEQEGTVSSFGKVKLITADGVNFKYNIDNNSVIQEAVVDEAYRRSADQMQVRLTGNITSGNIEISNYSAHKASELSIKDATLKATKAVSGSDGTIYLTSNNKLFIENTNIETLNAEGAEARVPETKELQNGKTVTERIGDVLIQASGEISIKSSNIKAVDNVEINSAIPKSYPEHFNLEDRDFSVLIDKTGIEAGKDVKLEALNIASVQNNSNVKANNVSIRSYNKGQVNGSNIEASNDFDITAPNVWIKIANITANNNLKAESYSLKETPDIEGGLISEMTLEAATLKAKNIELKSSSNIAGSADLTNSKTQMVALNDINLNLKGVGDRENGLVATAGNDMTLTTDGTLSVSSLISGNNMTLTANEIIAGKDLTTNHLRVDGDSADRSYIQVGGKFESSPYYTVTDSADLTPDGLYNKRHHIYYGSAENPEKILLVNKLPAPAQPIEPTPLPNVNDDQASMLNKLPQQPQSIKPSNNITDGRTMFLDVFAAASQIEIDDEEE